MEKLVTFNSEKRSIKEIFEIIAKFYIRPVALIKDYDGDAIKIVGVEEDFERLYSWLNAKYPTNPRELGFAIYNYHPIMDKFDRNKRYCVAE